MIILAWIVSIIGTVIIADRKNLNVFLFFILSLLLGPVALLIASLSSNRPALSGGTPLKNMSVQEAKGQLEGVKTSLQMLSKRLEHIESVLDVDAIKSLKDERPNQAVDQASAQTRAVNSETQNPPEAFEFVFGKYWLNRIGVVLFVIGIGLFINYTFHYFSAFMKIAIGYFFAVLFLFWGQRMERNPKFQKLAWGILGGAWGLFYLSTYAMYYVPATKIVTNSFVEFVLLALVAVSAIQYNLKYKSWIVTAMSYLLGFMTMAVGGLDASSVVFWALLLGSLAYLSFRFNWDELLMTGIFGAYAMYFFVLRSKLLPYQFALEPGAQFQVAMSLIAVAWVIFFITLLAKQWKDSNSSKGLLQAILFNTSAFAFVGVWEINSYQPGDDHFKYLFLLSLAVVHFMTAVFIRWIKKPSLIVVHCALGLTLMSIAVLIRFHELSVSFWWIIEMLMIFMLGIYYKQNIYRCMGWMLGVCVLLRFLIVDLYSTHVYSVGSIQLSHDVLLAALAAGSFFLMGMLVNLPSIQDALGPDEKNFYFFTFPIAGAVVLSVLMADESPARWLTLHWTLVGLGLLVLGFFFKHRAFRFCALGLLAAACARILFYDLAGVDTIYKIIVVIFLGATLLGVSLVYSKVKQNI